MRLPDPVRLFRSLLLLLWFVGAGGVQAAERVVSVCSHPIYPPISWVEDGRIHGVASTLVRRIFEDLGYKVSLRQVESWTRCLKEAEKGHIDVVAALYKVAERERYLLYTDQPVMGEPVVFFYSLDNPVRWTDWEDLKGKAAGVLLGDTFGTDIDSLMQRYLRVEPVSTGEQNFGKLVNGRIDLLPLGIYGGALQAQRLGYQARLGYIETPLTTEYWYIAISRKSPLASHLAAVNTALGQMKAQGEVERLMAHFSALYTRGSPLAQGRAPVVQPAESNAAALNPHGASR